MSRLKIALCISGVATLLSALGAFIYYVLESDIGTPIAAMGFMVGIVSYLFGGIVKALSISSNIAKWGWLIVPFPYDLLTFTLALGISLFVFACVPIIPVGLTYKQVYYR